MQGDGREERGYDKHAQGKGDLARWQRVRKKKDGNLDLQHEPERSEHVDRPAHLVPPWVPKNALTFSTTDSLMVRPMAKVVPSSSTTSEDL